MKSISNLTLTRTTIDDLRTLFVFQLDPDAINLAAFTPQHPGDKTAYLEKYTKHIADPTINMQTIWVDDVIVGSIAKFIMNEEAGITYWIDKKLWGRGIGTTALQQFLELEQTRPLFAGVAFDNYGSQNLLLKCGFTQVATDRGFANARGEVIEELIFKLG